jgi:hypothetical protein
LKIILDGIGEALCNGRLFKRGEVVEVSDEMGKSLLCQGSMWRKAEEKPVIENNKQLKSEVNKQEIILDKKEG